MKILYIDTETTGLSHIDHSLHQVSMIYEDEFGSKEYDFKIKPYKDVFAPSLKRGEIYMETLNQYPKQDVVFQEFINILNSLVNPKDSSDKMFLVGYNISTFDEPFLRQWFADNNNKFFGAYFWNPSIDVIHLVAKKLMLKRPSLENFKLETVCAQFKIYPTGQQHEALNDIRMTRSLYKIL